LAIAVGAALMAHAGSALAAAAQEAFVRELMPSGVQVINTEADGNVFADASGHTLYIWPQHEQRNGNAGEDAGKPLCDNTVARETMGWMSPYPPGLELPELDTRPTCTQMWPPMLAAADAKPLGKWSIVDRPDGGKQWAYGGMAVYTSVMDARPGDVLGGHSRKVRGDGASIRVPIGPTPDVPSQFEVVSVATGRLVTLKSGFSVYTWDRDGANKSTCTGTCLQTWEPVLAPDYAHPSGDWSIFERAPGIKQWAFRKKPVYSYILDWKARAMDGGDEPGWHNIYTQPQPDPPRGFFSVQDSRSGAVLADARGMTVYIYYCGEDSLHQLACDHPGAPQVYRFAVCGRKFDPADCVKTFPYVLAPKGAKSGSRIWSTMYIDPTTGKKATEGKPGALHVWAYRDRPIYTYSGDKQPGEINADGWGEATGKRNGFKAFWLRDAFRSQSE
jgi:predicted lipoprotein with Yx(FWY)xxD motif